MHCGPLKLLYWLKINRKTGFSRLRVMRWFRSTDPNNLAKGLTKFLLYLGKRYEPFNSLYVQPETESKWKYYAQHAQKLNQEGAAINSSELTNYPTRRNFTFLPISRWFWRKKICRTECATIHLFALRDGQLSITNWTAHSAIVIHYNPSAVFLTGWHISKTDWTPIGHSP